VAGIIALITDFGLRDHYVGAVKGVMLSICPGAVLVDITHDVPAHDVTAGALALAAAYRFFPAGTVFLAVVDPGVGSSRQGLVLEAEGFRFVAPDNGLLGLVMGERPRAYAVTSAALFREPVSATFHARDVFGPVAAHLAAGGDLAAAGPPLEDPVRLSWPAVRAVGPHELEATVVHVDHFGNLITSLGREELERLVQSAGAGADVVVALGDAVLPLVQTYADVPEGEACALVGSGGWLEVAVNQGPAARLLGAGRGTAVHVRALPAVL
jgi:S-adenosyl-L-methionine hydrolase (adenosine-forming)